MKYPFLICTLFFLSCSNNAFKRTPAKTKFTTIKVVNDVKYNRYMDVTALKLIKDTFRVNGSKVEWYRDSFYAAARMVTDTVLKKDTLTWVPVPSEAIVYDYNMEWK